MARAGDRRSGLSPRRWFAAASWVKLPLAGLLLEALGRRGLDPSGGLRLEQDGFVQNVIDMFDATLNESSIKPL